MDIGVSTAALSAADVTRVAITVSGPGISPDIQRDLTYSGGQWRGLIGNIPAGANRSFVAVAYDGSGANIYNGQMTGVTITRGGVATVAILLQQTTAPDPFLNDTPNIHAVLVVPGSLAPGDRAQVVVQASDPDVGDVLAYQWTATGGAFDDASVASTYFTAPMTEGTYALTIAVSDQKSAGRSVTVNVEVSSTRAVGKAFVIASFNTWPEVRGFVATPSLVAPGATTALTITTFDSESDTVALAMSDDCGGAFTGSSLWTAPAVAPVGGRCTLTVTATDGRGGTGLGHLDVVVGSEISANRGPIFVDTYQSLPFLSVAGSVDFSAEAEDPDADALTFSWTASSGTLGAVTTVGNVTSVTWTSGAVGSGSAFITVRATDAAGNYSEELFEVGLTGAAPTITSAYQSATIFHTPAASVALSIAATDPESDAITFSWSATSGSLGVPTNSAGLSEVVWTSGIVDATITARATDSLGNYVEHTFAMTAGAIWPVSCVAILTANPAAPSGVYTIDPDGIGSLNPLDTYCDMTTDGGGWTLFEMIPSDHDHTDATYRTTAALNATQLPNFATTPNQRSRMSADHINALCRRGQGYVRHRYGNNAPGYMLTDWFDGGILPSLDIALMVRGTDTYTQGFTRFGEGTMTVTPDGQWRRFNSYLSDNLVCTSISPSCRYDAASNPHGPLCDTNGCDKPGQRTVTSHMWASWTTALGMPSTNTATYQSYGSRWCR
ncbi:hypothetical protein L6R52_03715 [Myxococcota bacterium]|nr:hypothetical protein [Myxococcota bacterium]